MIKFKELVESNLSRVWQHVQNRTFGIITAHRSRYVDVIGKNKERNKELEKLIRSGGYGFINISGHYVENYGEDSAHVVSEECFLVIGAAGDDGGKLKGNLKKWGEHFNQDSILYKNWDSKEAVLIGTSKTDEDGKVIDFPGYGKSYSVGTWHPQKLGMFYSKMRNGKTFTFEETLVQIGEKLDEKLKDMNLGVFGHWAKHLKEQG